MEFCEINGLKGKKEGYSTKEEGHPEYSIGSSTLPVKFTASEKDTGSLRRGGEA